MEKVLSMVKANRDFKALSLKEKSESAILVLQKVIKNIDENNLHRINELGELQLLGIEIDTLCTSVKTLTKLIEDLEKS